MAGFGGHRLGDVEGVDGGVEWTGASELVEGVLFKMFNVLFNGASYQKRDTNSQFGTLI